MCWIEYCKNYVCFSYNFLWFYIEWTLSFLSAVKYEKLLMHPPGITFTFMQSTCTTFPTSSFFTYFRLLSIPVENFIALWPPPRFSVGKAVSIRYIQSVMPLTTKTVEYLSSACLANHTHQQKAFIYCFPPEDIGW